MLQRRPAHRATTRPRTRLVLARLALAGLSLSAVFYVANLYYQSH